MLRRADDDIRACAGTSAPSSPSYRDELASCADTERTFVADSHSLASPPSPAPLVYVSLTLPSSEHPSLRLSLAPAMVSREGNSTSANLEDVADEQRCPRCFCAYLEPTEIHAVGDDLFNDTGASSVSARCSRSSSVYRSAEEWGVLWTQVFPLHISVYLRVRDVIEVSQVCRMAHGAAQQTWVWRSLAEHHHSIQPAALEQTFSMAAREWDEERPTETPQRLRSCSPLPLLTGTNSRTPQRSVHFRAETAAHTAAGDDEDASSEEAETGELDTLSNDEGAGELDTTQPPRYTDAAMPSSAAVAAAGAASAPASPAAVAEEVDSAPHRSGLRALPSGTSARFLWQATAAAMPSPSSPVSSPPPEDDEAADASEASSVTPLPREAAGRSPAPLLSMVTAAAATACGAEQPNMCAPPHSAVLTFLTEGQRSTTALNSSVTGAEATAEGDASSRTAFFAGPLRCHPSYTLEMATDVTVDGAASPMPAAALSSAAHNGRLPEQASISTAAVYSFTLCRATAERTVLHSAPEFPWKAFTQYLHINRVQRSLSQLKALSNIARAELCRGGAWDAAYGALSRAIHVLFQAGSCRSVEHLTHLAETLVRRASLCRHRGHLYVLAAFTDLSVAWMLCPDSTASSDLAELRARKELAQESPATWLQRCNDAAHVATPVALLGIIAQVPTLFPQNRALCLCSALTFYMYAKRMLRHSLTHLLCRAAECMTPGTEEELLVTALREVAAAQQSKEVTSAQKACATADYAFSLLPLHVRSAAETLMAAWVRDCFPPDGPASTATITDWADVAPESLAYIHATPLEVRWVAWLVCEVRWFAYEELMGPLPCQTALLSIVFGPTANSRADGLVRLSMQYANADVRSEDLRPALPHGTSRGHLAQNLLESALQLRPLHPTAALLLARMHARDAEGLGRANAVLTDSIHAWAQRFSMLGLRGSAEVKLDVAPEDQQAPPVRESATVLAYLHRRDRRPEVCFIPSELLVERSRCLHTIADIAEATEQHPTLSYPYQMRAAMAMDRGYHLAAVMELNRIMTLTMDPNDIALRARFLQDAIAMASSSTEADASATASATAAEGILDLASVGTAAASGGNNSSDGELALPSSASTPPLPSLQLVPLYRAWAARMLGLLTLLRSPVSTIPGSQQLRSRFPGREWLPAPSGAGPSTSSEGHVSRVASMAFSDGDDEATLVGAATDEFDAAHVRAFLEDLLSPTAAPLALTAINTGARTPAHAR
ncbi:Ca2+-ATPase N terminal autoinhibitory domain family protein [Leishmania donovani]|uniref:Ca2+-ATPase N terminal autoinhibitory domain family protein n=1 Tax=Leishmania donovani TaxID=5661 RepID=A0A504XXT3_LEIDO|nr:Ca2+-ATPase N terminal autoinhibitory domain family protein [Leishmania donovani]